MSSEYEWDFFLAHAGVDTPSAEVLYQHLAPRTRVFLDTRCLLLGDDFDAELMKALNASRVTVVLVSENTESAYYQREEIALAIRRARQDPAAHRVVPLFLDASTRSGSETYGLTLKHGILLSDEVNLASAADRLVDLLIRLGVEINGLSQGQALESDEVTILFLTADPDGILAIEEEVELIGQALASAPYGSSINLEVVRDVTVPQLHQAMLEHQPDVVHFAGNAQKGELLLCDSKGLPQACQSAMVAEMLRLTGNKLQLAIMNACDTAGLAHSLTSSVPCAIGVDGQIADEAAIQFSPAFYRSMAFGNTVSAAFDQASIVLQLQGWGANAPAAVHEDLRLIGKETVARDVRRIEASTPRARISVPQIFWGTGMDPKELRLVGSDA